MASWIGEIMGLFSEQNNNSKNKIDADLKVSLDRVDANRCLKLEREAPILRDNAFLKRAAKVQEAPVIIASSDHVGTVRARLRHYEAYLDYYMEEEALKKAGAPIFPVFIR